MKEKAAKLYEQVADDITALIDAGTFRPGDRIPSVRRMSEQRKVSVTTILQAYGLLEDHGLIEARPQSGYYVRARIPTICPQPDISAPEPDPTKVSMRELTMMVMKDLFNPKLVPLSHRRAVLAKPAKPDPALMYPPYTDTKMALLRRFM